MAIGKHQVENDQVEALVVENLHGGGPGLRVGNLVPFLLKVENQALGDMFFVFNDEDMWRCHDVSAISECCTKGR